MIKSDIANRSSLGSMAEVRDIRVKTGEDVRAIRNALQERSVAAEIEARAIAERDAENFELRRENADYQRRIAELSNGEAYSVRTDALITEAM